MGAQPNAMNNKQRPDTKINIFFELILIFFLLSQEVGDKIRP
jgi:hypothetical protein